MKLPTPLDLINKSIGLAGVRVNRDLAYGPDARQKLDVYAPAGPRRDLPVIVFFYGGSWQGGNRAEYLFAAAVLARQGFVVMVPDYRVHPTVKFPAFLQDCAAAVGWAFGNAAAHRGDPAAVFLLGHSAGAYNAVMLALAPDLLDPRYQLAGVLGLAGPYDFLPLKDPVLKRIFAPEDRIAQTQPINFARADAPPMFLATGAWDVTVMPRNTTALAARLRALGAPVETRIYPKLGHIGIILAFLPYLAWRAPVLKDVSAFCADCRAGRIARPHSATNADVLG
jgi:acetyl esterase/lipase